MNYLLDTHTFIWWDSKPDKLSKKALGLCKDSRNQIFLSAANIWEMQIKQQLGKLVFDIPLESLISEQIKKNDIQILPIKPVHIFTLSELPNIHKDPFDRLLISQARYEAMELLSRDTIFNYYPVDVSW